MDVRRAKKFLKAFGFEKLPANTRKSVLEALRRQIDSILSENVYDVEDFKLEDK